MAGSSAKRQDPAPSLLLRVTNVLGFLVLIAVNAASATGVLGGKTNAEISARWPTPLTPAGWAFSIWGIIFLLQACGVVYQALPGGYEADSLKTNAVQAIGPLWQAAWLCQSVWQLAFLLESRLGMVVCVAALVSGLASLFMAMTRLLPVVARFKAQQRDKPTPGASQLLATVAFLQVPTSINAAWLSVATGLGVLIVPAAFDVPAQTIQYGAIGVAAAVVFLGVAWLLYAGDCGYGATLLWASTALAPKYADNPWIHYTQLVVMGALVALTALSLVPRPLAPAAGAALGGAGEASAAAAEGSPGEERRPLLSHSISNPRLSDEHTPRAPDLSEPPRAPAQEGGSGSKQ